MAWVRWGDNSHDHPILMNVMEHALFDDRLLNEVHGFISRCASSSGSHTTDYVITHGTAAHIAGASRVSTLVEVAKFAGYMSEIDVEGRRAYKLIDDDPDFLHLRLKAEIDFEKQRKLDHSNPALIIPVRLRDGDACRWCGRVVNWAERKSARSGTYDHLEPGNAATIETYIVSCKGCNSARGDGTKNGGQQDLRPVPDPPYFSQHTVDWIRTNQWAQKNGYQAPTRSKKVVPPGNMAPHTAEADSTSLSPAPAASSAPTGERTGNQPATAGMPDLSDAPEPRTDTMSVTATSNTRSENHSENAQTPDPSCENTVSDRNPQILTDSQGSGSVWSGRVGSGRVGSGRDGSPADSSYPNSQSVDPSKTSRGRRRRRSRKRSPNPSASLGDTHA